MAKNIVLCSDGTGNRGGKGHGTNVWRLYRAIDRNCPDPEQIAFYDDGVGTESNKYFKLFGGAFGWGFTENVKQLYKFLARRHTQDAHVYMFGFSRGAYTARALAAFVSTCGLVEQARLMKERDLDAAIDRLIDAYAHRPEGQKPVAVQGVEVVPARIKCVGVWDTVSAIGVPFDILLKDLIHRFFKFDFQDHDLDSNVDFGYHALAIDDERRSFHPVTWNARPDVEQVWFAGVHSNVGGGYPKQGMAYVTLDWMMEKVQYDESRGWGLKFEPGLRREARHYANVHDKLYDSRAGIAAYYRYTPRDIDKLMGHNGPVKIHDSVFDRIDAKTFAYNPANVPNIHAIEIVTTRGEPVDSERKERVTAQRPERAGLLKRVQQWVNARRSLHLAFVLLSMLVASGLVTIALSRLLGDSDTTKIVVAAVFVGITLIIMAGMASVANVALCVAALSAFGLFMFGPRDWFGEVAIPQWSSQIIGFALPDVLADVVTDFINDYPVGAAAAAAALVGIVACKEWFRRRTAETSEQACDTLREGSSQEVAQSDRS